MTDFNNFRGEARPLDDIDLPRIGHRIRVGEDEIHAVMDVEAAGGAWDARGRPKMLFEPHRFYKLLGAGEKRDRAVREGLAYPSWGEQPYPKDSYPRLAQAMTIDETAALESASWGLGQVMGENHAMVGYETPQAMVLDLLDDAEKHLEMMIAFILSARLDDDLRAHNWSGFARGYNGPQYTKHGYHTKLAAAYARWSNIRDTPWSPEAAPILLPAPQPVEIVVPRAEESAPIGHNGGPALEPTPPRPANPSPTPVEQASKAVGAGKWTAIVGTVWAAISAFLIATPAVPETYRDPTLLAGIGALLTTIASVVGAYVAPANAQPIEQK